MEWKGELNSDEKSKYEVPETIIGAFMDSYKESTKAFLSNIKDPILKKRLEDTLEKKWKDMK